MNVLPFRESLFQGRDVGDMGEEAQIDLAVVKRQEDRAFGRDERLPDPPAFFGSNRNILQIRIGR